MLRLHFDCARSSDGAGHEGVQQGAAPSLERQQLGQCRFSALLTPEGCAASYYVIEQATAQAAPTDWPVCGAHSKLVRWSQTLLSLEYLDSPNALGYGGNGLDALPSFAPACELQVSNKFPLSLAPPSRLSRLAVFGSAQHHSPLVETAARSSRGYRRGPDPVGIAVPLGGVRVSVSFVFDLPRALVA
ncbi:hypothetical protein BJV74DRAFT_987797 [Russula compacta]|nr:hypothetical protein BJV74DRAFT_987797 [Russula compacta]